MALIDYCNTDKHRRYAKAIEEHGSESAAARALGVTRDMLRGSLRHAKMRQRKAAEEARQGYSPERGLERKGPEGYTLAGFSDMRTNEEGKPIWYKFNQDKERQAELMREAIDAMADDLPRLPKTGKPKQADSELMAVYPLGDPHIGMLSWGEETGQDWDLAIAEEKFCGVFDRLVKTAPPCKQALIVNLGDFFHADNMEGVTSRSGHNLDTDGRFAKMIWVGIKIIRQMINSALQRHSTVKIINAIGNHDDTASLFLSIALQNIYEKEPRVIVDASPTPFHYVQHGRVLIGVHHGHTCKMQNLPGVMAAERPKEWGDTVHRYWLTGHIHHDSMKEYAGCKVESFRTLAARDAYAAHAGYLSGQDSKCLVMHTEHGEVERHTVNIDVI